MLNVSVLLCFDKCLSLIRVINAIITCAFNGKALSSGCSNTYSALKWAFYIDAHIKLHLNHKAALVNSRTCVKNRSSLYNVLVVPEETVFKDYS